MQHMYALWAACSFLHVELSSRERTLCKLKVPVRVIGFGAVAAGRQTVCRSRVFAMHSIVGVPAMQDAIIAI